MTNEYRRLSGFRACFIPLLIGISFAVGYLTANYRSQPGYSDIVVNRSPVTSVNTNAPQKPAQPPQSGNIRQDPSRYPKRPDQPEPNAVPDEQNALPSVANQAPTTNVVAGEPREKPVLALAGDGPQETKKYGSNRVQPRPNVNTGAQNVAPGKSKEIGAGRNAVGSRNATVVKYESPALAFEIVVSHYNEPLDWLKLYAKQSGHVYHKGFDRGPPFDMYKWEKLPNVGREAHTYLHHIIENYDNLADVTVFLQGHGSDNDPFCFADPKEFLSNAKKNIFCRQRASYIGWGRTEHIGKWLQKLKAGKMRAASMTMGEFYAALFGTQPPPSVPLCLSGCFSATMDNLRRHPLSFYQKAIKFVNNNSNPEEAYYFERLWSVIINAS